VKIGITCSPPYAARCVRQELASRSAARGWEVHSVHTSRPSGCRSIMPRISSRSRRRHILCSDPPVRSRAGRALHQSFWISILSLLHVPMHSARHHRMDRARDAARAGRASKVLTTVAAPGALCRRRTHIRLHRSFPLSARTASPRSSQYLHRSKHPRVRLFRLRLQVISNGVDAVYDRDRCVTTWRVAGPRTTKC